MNNECNCNKIVKQNFSKWCCALKSLKAENVSNLYINNVSFLPTVCWKFRKTLNETEDYFAKFLLKKPKCELEEEKTHFLSNNSYLHSWIYNFEMDTNWKKYFVWARFSFVWEKSENDNWKIVHHHSSIKPE